MKKILVLIILLGSINIMAQEDHDHQQEQHEEHHDEHDEYEGHEHGGGKSIGEGKAIELVDENKGFKLSKDAVKTLEIKLESINSGEFEIEKTVLVTSKGLKGIYRYRNGYFKFISVESIKEIKGKYLIKLKDFKFGDQIVTNGIGLLRVADVYSTDKSEYGHSH